jgi:hypothetical protein
MNNENENQYREMKNDFTVNEMENIIECIDQCHN